MTRHEPSVYIGDMVDAARAALRWMEGREWSAFTMDDMLQAAVTHQIQIIGEAATHLPPEFRNTHPTVPWRTIIAMRNILVHAYHQVALKDLWEVVRNDLPGLIASLEPLLPPEDE